MNGSRARIALVLLNLGLFAAIVYLGQHGVRRAAHADSPGPLPVEYAVQPQPTAAGDPSREIGAQFDPPIVVERREQGEVAPLVTARFKLLLVSEDREDPTRSTAIVASTTGDQQRTVAVGDLLDGFGIVHIGVHGDGDERRATLIAEREGERVTLQTERGARP